MRVRWHPLARIDVKRASEWYDNETAGLGKRFVGAVEAAVSRIARFGDTFAIEDPDENIRICPLQSFPYHICFQCEDGQVFILCVKHNHRHPDYGADRS